MMDSHDVSRGRAAYPGALSAVKIPTMVIGVTSDVLYPLHEQEELFKVGGGIGVTSSRHWGRSRRHHRVSWNRSC